MISRSIIVVACSGPRLRGEMASRPPPDRQSRIHRDQQLDPAAREYYRLILTIQIGLTSWRGHGQFLRHCQQLVPRIGRDMTSAPVGPSFIGARSFGLNPALAPISNSAFRVPFSIVHPFYRIVRNKLGHLQAKFAKLAAC